MGQYLPIINSILLHRQTFTVNIIKCVSAILSLSNNCAINYNDLKLFMKYLSYENHFYIDLLQQMPFCCLFHQ